MMKFDIFTVKQKDKLIEWNKYLLIQKEEEQEVKEIYDEAKNFIEFYDWCGEITEVYVGMLYLGIVGVFLFKIIPTRKDVDEWVWVIVGDLPSAYITTEDCPNPATALDGYIGAMLEWVEAAGKGDSVANLIPVNVPATKENSEMLKTRLSFLDDNILINFQHDLVT